MKVTLFADRFARKRQELDLDWPDLVRKLESPQQFEKKADAPLLKLATFGDKRTDKGSLRSDDNLLVITGLEGDYDGEEIAPVEALDRLERHGIRAVIYTSPSHTEAKPRWRVIAPLSVMLPKDQRDRLKPYTIDQPHEHPNADEDGHEQGQVPHALASISFDNLRYEANCG